MFLFCTLFYSDLLSDQWCTRCERILKLNSSLCSVNESNLTSPKCKAASREDYTEVGDCFWITNVFITQTWECTKEQIYVFLTVWKMCSFILTKGVWWQIRRRGRSQRTWPGELDAEERITHSTHQTLHHNETPHLYIQPQPQVSDLYYVYHPYRCKETYCGYFLTTEHFLAHRDLSQRCQRCSQWGQPSAGQ